MGLKEVLVNYQTEKLLLGFTVACVVLSALLPDIWPSSTRKDAPRFLNSAPRCVESLMDAVNVDMMEGHEPLPNQMHNPQFLTSIPGDARKYKFGESFDICQIRCIGDPLPFNIILESEDECTGTTTPFYYQSTLTCGTDDEADCTEGNVQSFIVPEASMPYVFQTCENPHRAQKTICASEKWFNYVFPPSGGADKLSQVEYSNGIFSFTTSCTKRKDENNPSPCVAYEIYPLKITPTVKVGEDCIKVDADDYDHGIARIRRKHDDQDVLFGLRDFYIALTSSECTNMMVVPESWPYGSYDAYHGDACFGKMFAPPNQNFFEGLGDDDNFPVDFPHGILRQKTNDLATRRPYLSRVTTESPDDDDKPRKTKAEKAKLSPKTVGLAINLDEPVSHSLDAAIDSMNTKCDKYLGRARAHTKLTGKPFDIFEIDYFPELALCNAIYGFPPAEQCASVLDPENHHLLGSSLSNNAWSRDILALEKALKTLTKEEIEKAHKMCTNATRATCGRHYPENDGAIRYRNAQDMADASKPPLFFEANPDYSFDETFTNAMKFVAELKVSPCIMKGMQGRSSVNKGRFFRNLAYGEGLFGVQNALAFFVRATEGD